MSDRSWLREPGRGRYARPERERRVVLRGVPGDATSPRSIEDRYIVGTTLRLRRVTDGADVVLKLTQKVRVDDGRPQSVATTNVYLTRPEYDVLSALPAHVLTKVRREWLVDGVRGAVDEMAGRWRGLVLAETPFDSPAAIAGVDVTEDERFTGAAIARASDDEVKQTLEHARRLLER